MKKFLTVLLALSVVFTYSFAGIGTAFADTTTDLNTEIAKAETQVLSDLATAYQQADRDIVASTVDELAIEATAWKAGLKAAYDDTVAAVKAQSQALKIDSNKDKTVTELVELYDSTKDKAGLITLAQGTDKYRLIAAKSQFETNKANYIKNAQTVDTSIYSTTVLKDENIIKSDVNGDSVDEEFTSNKAYADGIVAGVVTIMKKVVLISDDDTVAEVKAKNDTLKDTFDAAVDTVVDAKENTVYSIAASVKPAPLTTAAEAAANAQAEATKAGKKSTVQSNAATAYASFISGTYTADELALFNELKEAYVKVETFNIDNTSEYTVKAFPSYVITPATADVKASITENKDTYYLANLAAFAKTEKLAAELKVTKNADDQLAYDSKKIDEILVAEKVKAYNPSSKYSEAVESDFAEAELTYITDFNRAVLKQAIKEEIEEVNTTNGYFSLEKAQLKALFEELSAKIDTVNTISDYEALDTAYYEKIDKINNADAVRAMFTTGELKEAYDAVYAKLIADRNYILATNSNYKSTDFDLDWVKIFAEDGNVRTAAEVTAYYEKAKAKLLAVPTAEEKAKADDAAAAKVVELINKIPTVVKLTDKTAIEAAFDAYEALTADQKAKVSNINTLTLDISTLKALEKAEVDKAYDAIKTLTTSNVTIADKTVVKAAADAKAAYEATEMYGEEYTGSVNVKDLVNAIRALEKAEVEKLINALPTTVTKDDKETIEAARTAYDAFVAEYENITTDGSAYDAKDQLKTVFSKLASAEASLAVVTEYEKAVKNAEIKGGVKATTIKAKATAGKKYIKLTWKKSAGYKVDGYKVYRATKKNGTYKLVKTTKSTSFKNTKLKSGKTYYYKVRGYRTVDGKKVYTQYSAKVYKKVK